MMSLPSTSSSVGGSSARSTPVPHASVGAAPFKSLTPSQSLTALTKIGDDDLRRKGIEELARIVRHLQSELQNFVTEHNNIVRDVNRRLQINSFEIRGVKDINQKLQDDSQELRDLCCFLDDDRQRGRKLAREWQRFGRYTASVMRSEVSAYQDKLKELETKQDDLLVDNNELKELCLYLDQERLGFGQTRDDGDGSSNSTGNGIEEGHVVLTEVEDAPMETETPEEGSQQYVQELEEKIKLLEEEKKELARRVERNGAEGFRASEKSLSGGQSRQSRPEKATNSRRAGPVGTPGKESRSRSPTPGPRGSSKSPTKPESILNAMKVLEVHDQLERPSTDIGGENLDDKEKAIVREMCNVVWRKLGDVAQDRSVERATPIPVYENLNGRQIAPTVPNTSRRQTSPQRRAPSPQHLPSSPPRHPASPQHTYEQSRPSLSSTSSQPPGPQPPHGSMYYNLPPAPISHPQSNYRGPHAAPLPQVYPSVKPSNQPSSHQQYQPSQYHPPHPQSSQRPPAKQGQRSNPPPYHQQPQNPAQYQANPPPYPGLHPSSQQRRAPPPPPSQYPDRRPNYDARNQREAPDARVQRGTYISHC